MTYRVVVAPLVWRQARSVAEYYARVATTRVGARFLAQLEDTALGLEEFPGRFRLDEVTSCGRVHLRSYPYVMWYVIRDAEVLVLAISQARRIPPGARPGARALEGA